MLIGYYPIPRLSGEYCVYVLSLRLVHVGHSIMERLIFGTEIYVKYEV